MSQRYYRTGRHEPGAGAWVALGALGIVVAGFTVASLAGGSKPAPPPPPKDTDAQRGYQVLPSCRIKVIDETLAFKWAASLGQEPDLEMSKAIAKAIDNCTPEAAMIAAISSPEEIRILYFMLHALKSAAVAAGNYEKGKFNKEIEESLALVKMYGGGIDTSGWPGPLP